MQEQTKNAFSMWFTV